MITTAPSHSCGSKHFSTKTWNALPFIEPFNVITANTLFKLIAPITVTFEPR